MTMEAGAGKAVSSINITPLIDVLLVLLIIFMVIVPITPKGLSSEVPRPSRPGTSLHEERVFLEVTQDSRGRLSYLLNQSPVPRSDLVRSLSRLFSSRQNKTIFVQADPDLPYATVAEVIDMAHQAHVDQVGLITPGMQSAR